MAEFGRIDVWVNNAAVTFFAPFLRVPVEDFRRVIDVNVMGYVHGAQAALQQMRRQEAGVLINVSSIVGEVPSRRPRRTRCRRPRSAPCR
ncbi:SDR family NAD(P)-dependent oxidoreductase [Georgenia sp. AZ-5]|uniref:SDR family NAD(P)-dependent oxidoreductase n=1 Tax=Georgenia sp. AZ-5 TaxID=3367526 RepID=UPI0037544655